MNDESALGPAPKSRPEGYGVAMELRVTKIVRWFERRAEHRARVCTFCKKDDRLDGTAYCSDACAKSDAWAQANGG